MKIYDIILALYIFNLISNLFNATIFQANMLPTQGLDASNINATITDYQNIAKQSKEESWLSSIWNGTILTASGFGFLLKLFFSAFGFGNMLIGFGVNPLIVAIFNGGMAIVVTFGFFMLLLGRNTKWSE